MEPGPFDRGLAGLSGASRAARILLVEDHEDVRRMLVTALSIEGYAIDEAANAHEGIERLRQGRYDLVLTDYAMPGGTGTWMLHEATREGLMHKTVSLVVTAHPGIGDLAGVEVISKPVELDSFLEQIRRILAASTGMPERPSRLRAAPRRARHRVELVLYVSAASAASIQARRNLERLLEGFDASQVKFTICDLGRDPLAGEADRVAFTPTLVKRYPEPRMWVIGNLRESEIVADLLRVCGVDVKS